MSHPDPVEVIERAFASGAQIRIRSGSLVVRAADGSLDADAIGELRLIKPDLLSAFSGLGDGTVIPLSQGQKTMWLLNLIHPSDPSYNVGLALKLSRPLSRSVLREALGIVYGRQELARSVARPLKGEPLVFIRDAVVPVLEDGPPCGEEERLEELLIRGQNRPFDLANRPPFRIALRDLQDGGCILHLMAHHIACDGDSVPVLLEELLSAYFSLAKGIPVRSPACGMGYGEFVRWQAAYLASPEAEKSWSHWRHELDGKPMLPSWPGVAATSANTFAGETIRVEMDGEESRILRGFCCSMNVTPFCMFLSCFQSVLASVLDGHFWIGCPVSGRFRSGSARSLGYYVNILPFPSDLESGTCFADLLGKNQTKIRNALRYGDYPYNLLIRKLGLAGLDKGSGPVRILINHQSGGLQSGEAEISECVPGIAGLSPEGWTMRAIPLPDQQGQFDLAWSISDFPGGIRWELRHRLAAVGTGLASHINTCLRIALERFQANPSLPAVFPNPQERECGPTRGAMQHANW
jgi:hypothetical protein